MLRRKIDTYIRNYYAVSRNALLITGARQVGKTFSIREFGKSFKSFIEINFVEMPEAVEAFKKTMNSKDILLRLSALTNQSLIKGRPLSSLMRFSSVPKLSQPSNSSWMRDRIVIF